MDRQTANRELARFKQEQRQIDRSQGKLTLTELCDRYIKTVQHQTPKTVTRWLKAAMTTTTDKQRAPQGALKLEDAAKYLWWRVSNHGAPTYRSRFD
jgi:hypothetical protein